MNTEKLLFPHEKIRDSQKQLVQDINQAIHEKKGIIVHAPTGLGKTAAALSPAIKHAIDNKLTVFFLTSRHTQHKIAIETIHKIEKKYNQKIVTADLIGRRWMCLQPGIDSISSSEFNEFCKKEKEDRLCPFYVNTYDKKKMTELSFVSKKIMEEMKKTNVLSVEEVIQKCNQAEICPYEITMQIAKEATVIICDYNYVFDPGIREMFFKKTGKTIDDSIIIVDEGHNLPDRIRNMMTTKTSNLSLARVDKELNEIGFMDELDYLEKIKNAIKNLSEGLGIGGEQLVPKQKFISMIGETTDFIHMKKAFKSAGELIIEEKQRSSTLALSFFMEKWLGPDDSFVRIVDKKEYKHKPFISLSYTSLDPSLWTSEIIQESYSTIIMSGTLMPTKMYKDVLGFSDDAYEKIYESPFPDFNRKNMVIPRTTTKYSARSEQQFKAIAKICAQITNEVPGNTAIFFPSYYIRDKVNNYFISECKKTSFTEKKGMGKEEREELLENFKNYKETGAVLLGVMGGSFGEGIDLPGDYLKGVIIVGLPFGRPDLKNKALIDYYERKFGKGWDYGYIAPAFNKTIQGAGRCIRSKTDKGIIVFLDERFAWPKYRKYYPPDWHIELLPDAFIDEVYDFFNKRTTNRID